MIFVSWVFYWYFSVETFGRHTVDGSEILRSPVEVGNLSHYLLRVLYIRGGWEWDLWTINDRSGLFHVSQSFLLHWCIYLFDLVLSKWCYDKDHESHGWQIRIQLPIKIGHDNATNPNMNEWRAQWTITSSTIQERNIDECLTLTLPETFRASASSWFPTEYSICKVSISSIYTHVLKSGKANPF